MMRKRTLATLITTVTVAILALSACAPKSVDFAAGFKSADPTTFVTLEFGGVDTLDPALVYDSASGEILQQVYDTLVFYNREKKAELVPMLATEIPTLKNGGISADGLTYTFKIRKGVKFHSGEELTAEDVAFTFQRGLLQGGSSSPQWLMTEPLLGSSNYNDISDQLDPDGSMELIDNRDLMKEQDPAKLAGVCELVKSKIVADNAAGTVTFKLAQPWGPFIITLATAYGGGITQKAWVGANGGWDGDCATWQNFYAPTSDEQNAKNIGKMENGTGPYKLKEWGDTEIILVSNEDYWVKEPLWAGGPSGAPKLKTVILKYIDEFSTRFAAFKAGDGDAALAGSPENWPVMDELVGATCDTNGVCKIDDAAKPFVRYVKQDVAARTDAFFNFQINTEGGNDYIGSGKIDGNGVPPDFFSDIHVRKAFAYCFDWDIYIRDVQAGEGTQANNVMLIGETGDEANGAHYSYDAAKCAEEFKASTWKSDDGRSLWDVGFRLTIGYNSGNQARQSVAQIFRDNISAVNPLFKVESQGLEWPNYLDAYQTKKLPFFIIAWGEDIPDPHNWTFTYSAGAFGGKQGMPADLLAQFQPLVQQGAAEADPAKRAEIYKQFNKLYYDNVPAVLLAQAGQRFYFQRWVNGYYTNALYSLFYYYALSKS